MRSPVLIVAVALAAGSAPAVADAASWRISTFDAPEGSRLLGLAGRGDGRLSALLDVRAGAGHRLVIRTSGRSRVLMRSRHTFEGAMAADRHGRLTALWAPFPGTAGREAFVWSGGRVQRLTDGPGRISFLRLAVHPRGDAIVAITKGERMLVTRRGVRRGRFGPLLELPGMAGAPAIAAGGGPFAVAGVAPGADDRAFAVTLAGSSASPFGPAVQAPFPPPRAGLENSPGTPVLGFAPDGAVVLAYNVQHRRTTGIHRMVASSVYTSVWPRGAAEPLPPVELSRERHAYDPARVISAGRTWLTWLEGDGDCCRADTVVAAPLVEGGVGDLVRRRLEPTLLAGIGPPAIAAARGGGLRWYLPDGGRRASLRTIRLSPAGAFGATERILAGRALAPRNHVVSVVPARGTAVDVVGWMAPGEGSGYGPIRIARRH